MYWPIGIPNYFSRSKVSRKEVEKTSNVEGEPIIDLQTSRTSHIFVTITVTTVNVWQTKPTVLLATATRSEQSIESYGQNHAVLIRSDGLVVVIQTKNGYLITYSIAFDPNTRVYQIILQASSAARRRSAEGFRKFNSVETDYGVGDGSGLQDVNLRFQMAVKAGRNISKCVAADEEVIIATRDPSAIQCIKWIPDKTHDSKTSQIALLSDFSWWDGNNYIVDMVYDKPMGLYVWADNNGKAYAVQRSRPKKGDSAGVAALSFTGYCFHKPDRAEDRALEVAVNARFSLIAVGCVDACVKIYTAKDYLGNIPPSHELNLPVSIDASGSITFISHTPDGYAVLVGYEKGWAIWSVFGKLGANTFSSGQSVSNHIWINGMSAAFWAGGGSELFMLDCTGQHICSMNIARASITTCFSMANISQCLLQTTDSLMMQSVNNEVHNNPIDGTVSTWQTCQLPKNYLAHQWPIKCSVISPCGKYMAAAGKRGLVHYSRLSGRWKIFDDFNDENEFTIKGGMCWYRHILVAAVECQGRYQIRLYSRDKNLNSANVLHIEELKYPIIHISLADSSSLLVYTYANSLSHYIFDASANTLKITQIGQIGFHGIIRAPARVRSISWVVPDEQKARGEVAKDVSTAAVLFLVDGKLVLLQPSPEEDRELKYDMRIIAHDVEYYLLSRESYHNTSKITMSSFPPLISPQESPIQDSLHFFNGQIYQICPDVLDLLTSYSLSSSSNAPLIIPTVSTKTDFYPLSPMIDRGILLGLESELIQRRDVDFIFYRPHPRTQLFIPAILRFFLFDRFDAPAARHLSESLTRLPYFDHALEVLLHDVLEEDVEASSSSKSAKVVSQPSTPDYKSTNYPLEMIKDSESGLASLLPFLSSFPSYLSIILSCARKTDVKSWTTLFAHLPPVIDLFEEALLGSSSPNDMDFKEDLETRAKELKIAGGFLLVLHTFDEKSFTSERIARLLKEAARVEEWELCRELARFLVGIDEKGELLRESMRTAGMIAG